MNALTLAYVGDAVLELYVRKHLIAQGIVKPNDLHQRAVYYVSAEGQANVLHRLVNAGELDEEETAVVRRGRNAKSASVPKNVEVQTYRYGTAFEALIGYHHLNGNEKRVREIVTLMFRWIEEGETFGN
ncbi:MAG TPA: ribonuclease III domain-containing protein [Bacillales bacterium]